MSTSTSIALPRSEKLLTLAQARKIVATRTGRRVDFTTIWRWATKGLKGVQLEHVRAGRELRTSAEALDRFYARLADAYNATPQPVVNGARHAEAEAELDAAGV